MTYLVLNYPSSISGEYPGIFAGEPTNSFHGEKRGNFWVSAPTGCLKPIGDAQILFPHCKHLGDVLSLIPGQTERPRGASQ